jgi:hypothetical protein
MTAVRQIQILTSNWAGLMKIENRFAMRDEAVSDGEAVVQI